MSTDYPDAGRPDPGRPDPGVPDPGMPDPGMPDHTDPVELALLVARAQGVCDEMGALLRRASVSPNIKDRLDYSCALFDAQGGMFAQAAHIPVHLGSMAFAMASLVSRVDWRAGDVLVVNDPFLGGTHLPDVTLVAPAFTDHGTLLGFAANRAHHADIGADVPGSMPLSTTLAEEGVVIEPMLLRRDGRLPEQAASVLARLAQLPREAIGDDWAERPALADFAAQVSSVNAGAKGITALADGDAGRFATRIADLDRWAWRSAQQALGELPEGRFAARDALELANGARAAIEVSLTIAREPGGVFVDVDFAGSAAQQPTNLNCPLPVTAAAVLYAFRTLMPESTPAAAGAFRAIRLHAEAGSIVHAQRPAAVVAGNVETSMRIVDLVLRALADALPARVPAASQGTMNNLAMGSRGKRRWDYYETLAGGHGACADGAGASARHAHMTNTLNTPIESVEAHYPLRIERYALRLGSGGSGRQRGGDGVVRSYRFLEDAEFIFLAQRRETGPAGIAGGADGSPGVDDLDGVAIGGQSRCTVRAGSLLTIRTPGGGGWGVAGD